MFSDVMMSLQVSGVVTMQPHDSAQLSQVALGLTEQETSQLDGNSFIFLLFDNLDGHSQLREGSRAEADVDTEGAGTNSSCQGGS